MRKLIIPAMLAATLSLGGCATYGGGGGILGDIFGNGGDYRDGDYRNNGDYNYGGNYGTANLNEFERAAWSACGQQASRYGRVAIDRVDQTSRENVRVEGRIDVRDRNGDQFGCIFRNDGRVTDFRRF